MSATNQRYHSLDALRAAMMLLGLVLHSAISFTVTPLGAAWPYKDAQTHSAFDLAMFFIHMFRMPVFFVAAGFFAAMLMQRDGMRAFLANRAKRVLLPLVLFWPFVFAAVAAGFIFTVSRAAGAVDMRPLRSGAFVAQASLAHLWFLWDLMLFCAAAALIAPAVSRMPETWIPRIDSVFGAMVTTVRGLLVMSAITAVTLLPMDRPALDTSPALLPPIRILLAYGVFFTFGWLLYRRRDLRDRIAGRWKPQLLGGTATTIGCLVVAVGAVFSDPRVSHAVACALAGLATWLLIFGFLGMFVSRFARPSPVIRYLSDASYWMYIVHLPIVIAVPGVLAPSPLPAVVKFAITLVVTTAATLVSYHFLVRSTAIGALLNGRRYARSLPPRGQVSKTDILGV